MYHARKIQPIRIQESQTCPGLNTNEILIPYDKRHKLNYHYYKVSLLVKSHQNTHSSVKFEET